MKNKITKLSFVVLMITGIAYGQNQPMSDKVRQATNVEFLQQFAKEKTTEFERNYDKVVEIARQKRMPISGVNERGQFYTVYKYDEASDVIIHKTTYNNISGASSIKTIKMNYLHALDITGSGMTAGIWDGGIPRPTHAGLSGRVTTKDNGNTGMDADGIDHGTHVGGTIASSGISPIQDTKGMAPAATLWAYNWNNDEAEMATAAQPSPSAPNNSYGLLVSNHSYGLDNYDLKNVYGVGIFGRYTTTSKNIDQIHNNAPYYVSV